MRRILEVLGQALKVLVVLAVVLWVGDWLVFHIRASRGNGYDTVQVQEFLSTALKGNKEEYDYLGTAEVTCARSIFPHAATPACWWVRRHRTEWE